MTKIGKYSMGNSSAHAYQLVKHGQQLPHKSNPNALKFLYAMKSAPAS